MALMVPSIYRHTQDTAALTWTVQHNLGGGQGEGIPVVDVFIDEGGQDSKMIPASVEIIDRNSLLLTFSVARAGFAVVIV
jgi:hypothetical protein